MWHGQELRALSRYIALQYDVYNVLKILLTLQCTFKVTPRRVLSITPFLGVKYCLCLCVCVCVCVHVCVSA